MKRLVNYAAAGLLSVTGHAAIAQQSQVFSNEDAVADSVEATEDAVREDFERSRDEDRFGFGRKLGWYGSVSATANASSGNTDTTDVGIGARFGHFDGTNGHDVTFSYTLSDDEDTRTANSGLLGYDYSRVLTERWYGYGKLRAQYDEFGAFEEDYFAGVGIGYRIIDSGTSRWRVQGGPGWRVTEASDGIREEEGAALISSKFYHRISDTAFLTNDTDILYSDTDTLISNDLGVNVTLSGPLALRASLRSDHHTDPTPGRKHTDHRLGMSLVYTFN